MFVCNMYLHGGKRQIGHKWAELMYIRMRKTCHPVATRPDSQRLSSVSSTFDRSERTFAEKGFAVAVLHNRHVRRDTMAEKALPLMQTEAPSLLTDHPSPFVSTNLPRYTAIATPLPEYLEQKLTTAVAGSPQRALSYGSGPRVPHLGNRAGGGRDAGKQRTRCSYSCMVGMALRSSPTQTMLAKEIYAAIE